MAMAAVEMPPRLGRIRTGSHPSLTHSSTTDGDHTHTGSSTCGGPESLLTPGTRTYGERGMLLLTESDEEIMDDQDLLQGPVPRGYDMRGGGLVTRSMADLKAGAVSAGGNGGGRPMGPVHVPGRDRSMSTGASQTVTPGGKPTYIPSRPPNALIAYPGAGPSSGRYDQRGSNKQKASGSSGFASFFRKLTGKKAKEPKEKVANPMDVLSRPDPAFRPVVLPDPVPPQRSMTFGGASSAPAPSPMAAASTMAGRRPMPTRIQTDQLGARPGGATAYQAQTMPNRRPTQSPPLSAPPVMAPMLANYPVMAPTTAAPPTAAVVPPRPPRRESDPAKIPLPPSPVLAPQTLPFIPVDASGGNNLGLDLIDFNPPVAITSPHIGGPAGSTGSHVSMERQISRASAAAASSASVRTGTGAASVIHRNGDSEDTAAEDEEEDDLPAPLPMIRIPSNSSAQGRRDPTLAHSPLSVSSAEMPSAPAVAGGIAPRPSLRDPSPPGVMRTDTRVRAQQQLDRSLPPGAAPPDPAALARRDSKWRQSMMNISDSLNGRSASHRTSVQPPSSFDSYSAAQRRRANNRVSCQPTMHTSASIAAQLRAVQNKEDAEVAENFFM